jgi:hypothetical protein
MESVWTLSGSSLIIYLYPSTPHFSYNRVPCIASLLVTLLTRNISCCVTSLEPLTSYENHGTVIDVTFKDHIKEPFILKVHIFLKIRYSQFFAFRSWPTPILYSLFLLLTQFNFFLRELFIDLKIGGYSVSRKPTVFGDTFFLLQEPYCQSSRPKIWFNL